MSLKLVFNRLHITGGILYINNIKLVLTFAVHCATLTMNIKKYLALKGLERLSPTILIENEKMDDVENITIINMPDVTENVLNEDDENNLKECVLLCLLILLLIALVINQLFLLKLFVVS